METKKFPIVAPTGSIPYRAIFCLCIKLWTDVLAPFTGRTFKQLCKGVPGILWPTEKSNIFKGLRRALRGGTEDGEAARTP